MNVQDLQLIEPNTYGHGSIRNTLVHILSAEWVWRVRCQEGISPIALLALDDFPSLDTLQQRWDQGEHHAKLSLRADRSGAKGLVRYRRTGGDSHENTLWQLLVHVVNHGSEQRSTLAAELTKLGHSPVDLDIVHFVQAKF